MKKVTNWETVVASEAPPTPTPRPQSNMKMGSSTTFSTAPMTTDRPITVVTVRLAAS